MWNTVGLLLTALALVAADTPANCTYEDIQGTWIFYETARTSGNDIKCVSNNDPTVNVVRISLEQFETAVDEYGNMGTWTIIYNQGFEVSVNERTYFAFSKYEETDKQVTSMCDLTQVGWSHDVTSRNWACFRGYKTESVDYKVYKKGDEEIIVNPESSTDDLVRRINAGQKSWKAKKYERFEGMSTQELINLSGGVGSAVFSRPTPASQNLRTRKSKPTITLPDEFDWRNVDGVNYVPEVRDQGNCGSCYIFASLEMLEARIRIMTNNTKQPILSPQHALSCSEYSQGCSGGFPYLIAGKFAQDFGLIEEEYMPYQEVETECKETSAPRHYVADYDYVGGYYGASNEENMMEALVTGGPLAIGFEVYPDFRTYTEGVYHHTWEMTDSFDPFVLVNHAVLIVGYGTEKETGEKYWTVMNSWGAEWGDHGFFKIRRGVNECGIESLVVEATPIP